MFLWQPVIKYSLPWKENSMAYSNPCEKTNLLPLDGARMILTAYLLY